MIVDDHEIVRRGVAELLTSQHDLTVVAEAATVAEASRRMALVHPDLLLVDLQLPDGTGDRRGPHRGAGGPIGGAHLLR